MPLIAPSTASAFIQWAAPGGAALSSTLTSLTTWSISFWIEPQAGAVNRSIFHGGNSGDTTNLGLYINTTGSGAEFRVQLHNAAGTNFATSSTATTGGATRPINTSAPWSWNLVTIRHKNNSANSSDIQVIATGQNGTTYLGANTNYDPAANSLPTINFARLGKASPTGPISLQGEYGGLVVRNHDTTQAEHEALYALASPGRLLNYSSGVNWNNTTGLQWGIANTMASHPTAQDAGTATAGLPNDWSTQSTAAASNIFIFDRAATTPSFFDVYPTATTLSGTWTYGPVDTTRFPFNTPTVNNGVSVSASSPHFLDFANAVLPSRVKRILSLGNSRSMRFSADKRLSTDLSGGNDAFGAWPQFWGGGLILERLALIGGTFGIAPNLGSNNAAFGLSYDSAARASSSCTGVNNNRALRRFGYGSNSVGSTISGSEKTGGPGESAQISTAGGYYQTLTNEVTGSLYTFDRPRSYQVTCLAYPSSSPATLSLRSSNTSRSDASATSRASNSEVVLDTQRGSATIISETGLSVIKIPSVGANDPIVGDAFTVKVGSSYDVSVVESLEYVDSGTNINVTLEHAVANIGTLAGTTAYWGPWGFVTMAISAAGDEAWVVDAYHGYRLTAGTGTSPVVILAEAWGTTDPSYWVGSTGWSGNGYTIHIVNAFTTVRDSDNHSPWTAFFDVLAPDVALIIPAQQNAITSSIGAMTDSIRDAIPECEVLWVADHLHGRSDTVTDSNPLGDQDYSDWFEWMEANAASYGVAYIAEPAYSLGVFTDQMTRGFRSNSTAHDTSEGVRIWAASVLETAASLLTEAADSSTDFLARLYSRARGFVGRLRI